MNSRAWTGRGSVPTAARPRPRWRGKKSGPNPTDRAKQGTKRSLLVEAAGVPVALVVAGANRNDHKLLGPTLARLPTSRPLPSAQRPQSLCLDKGYDYPQTRALAVEYGLALHLRTRGEEVKALATEPGYRPRRWVVERTHSWLNRFRRLLVRWEKQAANYEALLHLACACITWQQAGLFG
ncbi:MAG: transposase [Limisphaerales bacterium]|nr:MAG: transposase [Limisphaerales bacterium]